MQIIVRRAQIADLQAMVKIDEALFGEESFPSFSLRQFMDLFPESVFVAEQNETLIGYAAVGVRAFSKEAWLLSMAVSAAHQSCGIGTRLLTACIDYCKNSQIESCRLTTDPSNVRAISLYNRFGFEIDSEQRGYYEPGDKRLVLCKRFVTA